jgi:5-deoxy-glucuronate isomerase
MDLFEQGVAGKMIFRRTHEHLGRHISITPANSSMRHLAYGRVVLNSGTAAESFSTEDRETGLICLSGRAVVTVDQKEIEIGQYDAVYVPRDSTVSVSTNTNADIAEVSCDVKNRYPLQVVRAAEICNDPKLNYQTGGPGCSRHIRMSLGKNIEAGRLLAGITQAEPGNWTSWPPHEHAAMLEEIYIYFEMPAPAYGIQLVYSDHEDPELVTVVRDGDAVVIPKGYHPNVSVPGHRICFLWAMAAHREVVDRQYGVVNVERGFNV